MSDRDTGHASARSSATVIERTLGPRPRHLSRRTLLRLSGFAVAGLVAEACTTQPPTPTVAPTARPATAPTTQPTAVPAVGSSPVAAASPSPAAAAASASPAAAASPGPAASPSPAAAAPVRTAPPTGSLVIAQAADMIEIDPHRELWSQDSNLHFAIFDSLTQRDDDMKLMPALAESYQNTGPTEWTFKLRPGIKFHNGEPLDSAAIKWNVEDALKPGAKRDVNFVKFDRVEVVDATTFKLYTKQPDPILPLRLVRFFILPPKYYDQVGEDGFIANPVGSGAYKWVERQKDNYVKIEAIDNYWRGNAYLKNVTFRVIPDASTRLSALRAGEVDLIDQLPPDQFDTLNGASNTKAVSAVSNRYAYVQFWPESPQGGSELKDKRVRQAINYAVNVDNIIKFVLAGHAARQVTLFPSMFYGFDTELKPFPYDPDRAKSLLKDAGLPDGFSITLEAPTAFVLPKTLEIAQAIGADLGKVGIKVNVKPVELAALIKERGDKQIAPMFLWSWASDTLDPEPVVRGILHTASPYTFYGKPEWDKLIDAAGNTVDQPARAQMYRQLQREMFDDPPDLFLYTIENIYGLGKAVTMTPRTDERVMVRQIQKPA